MRASTLFAVLMKIQVQINLRLSYPTILKDMPFNGNLQSLLPKQQTHMHTLANMVIMTKPSTLLPTQNPQQLKTIPFSYSNTPTWDLQ